MDTITAFDWHRLLIGDAPPLYLLEIILRIAVIWPWTMLLLRWIGGRSISQLSLVEFLLVIALGSAVGDSLFVPDVPLLHAMLVVLVVVGIDKGIDLLTRRFAVAQSVIDGHPIEVVRDGVILMAGLSVSRINTAELMELLRVRKVENLGTIRRAYLEPSGQLSVFAAEPPLPGLPIVPPVEYQDPATGGHGPVCCGNCGLVARGDAVCRNCGADRWRRAERAGRLD